MIEGVEVGVVGGVREIHHASDVTPTTHESRFLLLRERPPGRVPRATPSSTAVCLIAET
ncbi:hypothetical protein ABID81_002954 [Frigoribacterium sp. PvP054]